MFKSEKGLTGIDIALTIIIIVLFTSIIFSLMYNVKYQNLIQVYKLASNIYLTETLENIGIENYDDIVAVGYNESSDLKPEMPSMFSEQIQVENFNQDSDKEDIIKKVTVTISYKIKDKTYEETAERLKIKE